MNLKKIIAEADKQAYDVEFDVHSFFKVRVQKNDGGLPFTSLKVVPYSIDLLTIAACGADWSAAKLRRGIEVYSLEAKAQKIAEGYRLTIPAGRQGNVVVHVADMSEQQMRRASEIAGSEMENLLIGGDRGLPDYVKNRLNTIYGLLSEDRKEYVLEKMRMAVEDVVEEMTGLKKIWDGQDMDLEIGRFNPGRLRIPSMRRRFDRFLTEYAAWAIIAERALINANVFREKSKYTDNHDISLSVKLKEIAVFYSDVTIEALNGKKQMIEMIHEYQKITNPIGLADYGANIDSVIGKYLNNMTLFKINLKS